MVSVRYIVDDIDGAIQFYIDLLGFELKMHPAPAFAILTLGDLRLLLSAPGGQGGGGQTLPDGQRPKPGGWNRISLQIENLDEKVKQLREKGAHFAAGSFMESAAIRFCWKILLGILWSYLSRTNRLNRYET